MQSLFRILVEKLNIIKNQSFKIFQKYVAWDMKPKIEHLNIWLRESKTNHTQTGRETRT